MNPMLLAGLGSQSSSNLLSFGGDLFSAAINYEYTKKLMEKQQNWQKYVAQNQHSWNVESLRKAGLNPLLSATGGVSSSSGGSAPSFHGLNFKGFRSPDVVGMALTNQQIQKGGKELDLLDKQKEKLEAEIASITASTRNTNADTTSKDLINKFHERNPNAYGGVGAQLLNGGIDGAIKVGNSLFDLDLFSGGTNFGGGFVNFGNKRVGVKNSDGSWSWYGKDKNGNINKKDVQYWHNGFKR